MATKNRNIPLSIDDELLAEIDRMAEAKKESRSAIMRQAIREGLPVMEKGGNADTVALDGELSKDVDQICKAGKMNRAKAIIECIRTGAQACFNRVMREQVIQSHNPEEAESLLASLETLHGAEEPMNREWRTALRQRGAAVLRLWDILMHVPEAWRRYQLIERLVKIRRSPGGGGGRVWGAGLSTDEIEWQVKMADKYGIGAHYPEAETAAREAARQREDWTHRNLVSDYFSQGSPLE